MNVVVNGRFLARPITGVERYGHEILRRLEVEPRIVRNDRLARGAAGYAWEQLILPLHVHKGDILWSPANLGPLAVKNQVLTLHDVSPLEHPEWFAARFAAWYRLLIPRLVHRVRTVTVPSVYVQAKTIRLFNLQNDRVTVIPGGVDTKRFRPGLVPLDGIPERYLLFVGSVQPRKNLGLLLKAWKEINHLYPDVWLVAAGETSEVFKRETLPENLDRFRWIRYVAEDDLPRLYAGALAFILPSLDEGYGLPILEAMACGTVTIISRAGAMPEVAGDAALYFHPSRVDELIEILATCLNNAAFRQDMSVKGLAHARNYPWENSATKLWETIEKWQ